MANKGKEVKQARVWNNKDIYTMQDAGRNADLARKYAIANDKEKGKEGDYIKARREAKKAARRSCKVDDPEAE